MTHFQEKFSRRKILKFIALGATAPILNTFIGQAQAAKASKEAMQYRDKPNGKEQCSNCAQFISSDSPEANGECKVVEGDVSPQGWCIAYVQR
ncbi:high-potential iron-sulfur protein [Nitrosomonas supralitoralis]|uniref:High-potential iron-sulfur protein n=1 Tax=Nitrosomonas supralitoralis TaxID=2116706 RepID=A0A2P7NQY9_9PROT|nr:high-potential iron-sulfur protein [Nitrosomonas supralitoralis]PSJ15857.1 iron oxidase [Nitrosomonas supralitoralis]